MVRRMAFCTLLMLLGFLLHAQITNYAGTGLVRTGVTFSPSIMLFHPDIHYYINGQSDFFFEDNISLRSDLFFVNYQQNNELNLKHNSLLLTGPAFHYSYGKWDSWISIQPGLELIKMNTFDTAHFKSTAEPVLALSAGVNFYFSKYFHFFINGNINHSNYNGGESGVNMDEARILAGLGFHIHYHKFAYWENHLPDFQNK